MPIIYSAVKDEKHSASIGVTFQGNRKISSIEARDRSGNRTGGTATLIDGSLGSNNFYITINSLALGLGIDFDVIVYGIAPYGYNDLRFGQFLPGNELLYS